MPQLIDDATYQLYETYHIPVNVQRDLRTYDHFSSNHSRTLRQEELLTGYLAKMIAAIRQDLNARGDCWLLRAIVQREVPAIHLLDHSAIAYVYASLFTPDELPRLDTRTIPYSSAYSASAGGMRFADRHAKGCVIDLRSDAMLHLLCHALLMYAEKKVMELQIAQLLESHNTLMGQITQLNDSVMGLQHQLMLATAALSTAAAEKAAPAEPETPTEAAPAVETPDEPEASAEAASPAEPEPQPDQPAAI